MISEETKHNLELYILGQLDTVKSAEFEGKLKQDKELQKEYHFQRELMGSIQSLKADEKMAKDIQLAGEEYLKKKQTKSTPVRTIIYRIATAAVIIFGIVWFTMLRNPIDIDMLYAENFQIAEMIEFDRGSEQSEIPPTLLDAYTDYQDKNFGQALESFEQAFQQGSAPKDLNYAGMCALAKESPDFGKAKAFFKEILNSGENLYVPSAQFHLGLIALKTDDLGEAKSYYNLVLQRSQNKYQVRARTLLDALE